MAFIEDPKTIAGIFKSLPHVSVIFLTNDGNFHLRPNGFVGYTDRTEVRKVSRPTRKGDSAKNPVVEKAPDALPEDGKDK